MKKVWKGGKIVHKTIKDKIGEKLNDRNLFPELDIAYLFAKTESQSA